MKDEARGTDVAGKQYGPGKAVGEDSIGAAVGVLHGQHPHKWSDRGPHHEPGRVTKVKSGKMVG